MTMANARAALRLLLWSSAAAAVFLAFGWPFVVSSDPASAAFRLAATVAVGVFLACLAALLAIKAGEGRRERCRAPLT